MNMAVHVTVWKKEEEKERREESHRWPEHAALLVPTN